MTRMKSTGFLTAITLFLMLTLSWGATSHAAYVEQKLTASDAAATDRFGSAVSISGEVMVVGSSYDDGAAGVDSGAAYVYRYNGSTWQQEQKLTASDAAAADRFGSAVSISDNVIVIGASLDDVADTNTGSVYVYRYNGSTWQEEQKLTATNARRNDYFGYSVSVSGDHLVIGVPQNNDNSVNSGAAYIYHFNGSTWHEEAKLTASDAMANDQFGYSVSIKGVEVVVGAYQDDDPVVGADSGSAYVYRYNGSTWQQEQKLTASDAAAADRFGSAVSISGEAMVVGSNYDDGASGADSGAAYVYRYNGSTWQEEQKLIASDAAAGDQFGYSVSISGDAIVVGAPYNDDGAFPNAGAAYLYRYNGTAWTEEPILHAGNTSDHDVFGFAVAVSGGMVAIGAEMDSDNGLTNAGSVYIYTNVGS